MIPTSYLITLKHKILLCSQPCRNRRASVGNTEDICDQPPESDGKIKPTIRNRIMMVLLLCSLFLSMGGDSVLMPFFPQEGRRKGLTPTHIGFVFSAFEFSVFAASPVIGSLLLRFSPKKMCIAGAMASGSAGICFGLIKDIPNQYFLASCIIARLISGFGCSLLLVVATSILMKHTPYASATIIGVVEVTIGCGITFGPSIGGGLFVVGGYRLVFGVLGGAAVLCGLLMIPAIPKLDKDKEKQKSFLGLLKIPGALLMFVHCIMLRMIRNSYITQLSAYLVSTYHINSSTDGIIFGVLGLAYLVSCPLAAKVVRMNYDYTAMLIAWGAYTVVLLFIVPSPLLNFIFHGKSFIEQTVALQTVTSLITPFLIGPPFQTTLNLVMVNGYEGDSLQTYGMIAGLVYSGLGLGAMFGPIVAGALIETIGFPQTTTVMSGLALIMLIILSTYRIVMRCTNRPLKPSDLVQNQEREEDEEKVKLLSDKLDDYFQKSVTEEAFLSITLPKPESLAAEPILH